MVGILRLNQVKKKPAPKATQGRKAARKGAKETPSVTVTLTGKTAARILEMARVTEIPADDIANIFVAATIERGDQEAPADGMVMIQLPKPLMDALDAIMAITGEQVNGSEWIYQYLHGVIADEPINGLFACFLDGPERRKAAKAIRPIVDAYNATCGEIDMSFLKPRLRAKFFAEAEREGITPRALLSKMLARAFASKRELIQSRKLNQEEGGQEK